MSVVINAQSGLAEDLPEQEAQSGLQSGSHLVLLNDEQGNPVHVPLSEANKLVSIQGGYTQPTEAQLKNVLDYAKFNTPTEQAKTFAEGAASAATFGASTAAQVASGLSIPEDISARREVNPGMHSLGAITGLMASSLVPGGAAKVLGGAGKAVVEKLGLEATPAMIAAAEKAGVPIVNTFTQKVGSAAVKGAVETALFNTGDEVSKLVAKDPGQTVENALINIGVGGLLGGAVIGGGIGTVPALWKAANETKAGQFLNAIRDKANGLEKPVLPGAGISDLAQKAGVEVSPTMKAAISENPVAREFAQQVAESNASAGAEMRAEALKLRENVNEAVLKSVGKDESYLSQLPARSEFEQGQKLVNTISKNIEERIEPLAEGFERIKLQNKAKPLVAAQKEALANQISDFAQANDMLLSKGPKSALINDALERIPQMNRIEQLANMASDLGDKGRANVEILYHANKLKDMVRAVESDAIEAAELATAKTTVQELKTLRANYGEAYRVMNALDEKLKLGSWAGPKTFVDALKNAIVSKPEEILRRLTPKGDVSLLNLMAKEFPESVPLLRDTYIDTLMKAATKNPPAGMKVDPKVLFNAAKEWSPELRDFVLPKGATEALDASQQLLKRIPPPGNPPHTARTLDNMWSHAPGGAMAMVSMITGHNPLMGYVIGQLGRYAATEIPAAMKLSALKFLGSELPVNSVGFKAMADMISHTYKGNGQIINGIKNLFKAGAIAVPSALETNEKKVKQIKKQIENINKDPTALLNVGGDLHYYMPEVATELGAMAARTYQYLNNLLPKQEKSAPLDDTPKPTRQENYKFERAVAIADNPLTVLNHIKTKTLTQDDVDTVKTLYPSLYQGLVSKITSSVIEQQAKGKTIPYDMRTQLSRFIGQPLDSTQTPEFIRSMQSNNQATQPQQATQPVQQPSKGSMKALQKLPGIYATAGQQAEARKGNA